MKAFFMTLAKAIGTFWQAIIADWRIMLLIIIGLMLFIVSWLLFANLSSFMLLGQLLMSLLCVLVYSLVIGLICGFRYLVNSSALTTLAKKAKGSDALTPTVSASNIEIEIKQFLTHKFAWKRFVPLALQKLFVRKKIYLLLEQNADAADYLEASGYICLDNPENLPVNVWAHDKKIIIVVDASNKNMPVVLHYLARYCFLRRLSGVMHVVSINDILTQNSVYDVGEKLQQQQKLLSRHTAFKNRANTVLISNLGLLPGATEAITIPEFNAFFGNNNNISTSFGLQHITANITKFSKSNPETVDNAKLYWLLNSLANVQESVQHTSSGFTWLLLEPNAVANKLHLLNHSMQQLKQSQRGLLLSRFKLSVLSGFMAVLILSVVAMVTSFSINYQKITRSISLLNQYQNLPWASYSATDLAPAYKSLQLYSVYQTSTMFSHMGLYQGDKVESILQPLLTKQINQRYIPQLNSSLQQLLDDSVSHNKNVAQALSAYLMLSQPHYFDAAYVADWLKANKAALANPESVAMLSALQAHTFNASKANKPLLAKAKKSLPSLSTQIRYQLVKQASTLPTLDINTALSGSAEQLSNPASLKMSSIYGKASLEAAVNQQPGNVVDSILHNIWFYNTTDSQQALRQHILDEYIASYINHWHDWTNRVQFKSTTSLKAAISLAQTHQIWQPLAQIVVNNTHFNNAKTGPLAKVTNAFSRWEAVLNASGEKATRQAIAADFTSMSNSVKKLAKADNPNQAAFKALQAAMTTGDGLEGFDTLNATVKTLPQSLQQWLLHLRTAITAGIFSAAHQNITDNLKPLVANQLDSVINQYPFNTDSQNDVDPAQLSKLFAKEGAASVFVDQNITPFYAIDTNKSKSLYGASIMFSDNEQKFYSVLANISNSFFGNNGDALQIAFSLSPTYLSNSVGSARLSLLNNTMLYQHGPQKPISYSWPTSLVNLDANLQLTKSNGAKSTLTDRGIWAWLRLLAKADAEPTAEKNVWKLRYHIGNAQFQLQVIASPAMNVVLKGDLANLQLANSIVENNNE